MKYSKLVALGLIGVLGLGIVGCTNKKEETQTQKEITNANEEMMTRDMYTEEFGKYYNENIARLENYNGYTNILVDKETEGYPGNEKYLEELKTAYKESEVNLQKFIDSLRNVKTEDTEVKDMNDKLIAEGEKLIADIKEKSKKLDTVPEDLMTKSEVEFRKGINDLVIVKDQTEMGFNKMLKDVRNSLGIK
ncbi:MAG: hypothetical protein ACRCXT_21775 [Paraclostridium sp.]